MRRVFGIDVLACPQCEGRCRVIACIEDPVVIRKILTHLGLPATGIQLHPARLDAGLMSHKMHYVK
jgi:hypothetical protein